MTFIRELFFYSKTVLPISNVYKQTAVKMATFDLEIDSELDQILGSINSDDADMQNMSITETDVGSSNANVDALNYIKNQRAVSTTRKTNSDIKKFVAFVRAKGDDRNLVDIPPSEMDTLVSQFIMQLKKPNGSPYEPDSITAIFR